MAFANNLPEKERSQSLPDGIDCPLCGGNGYAMVQDVYGYEVAKPCQCLSQRILNSRIRYCGLPEALKDIALKTFSLSVYQGPESKAVASVACQVVKYYLDHFDQMKAEGKGLYLYSGTKGSGKTRMAASIANELMRNHDTSVRFSTSITILDEIKNSWNAKEYTERQLLDSLFTVPVLIIDDFGAERATEWAGDRFYQIINERYINNRVTIFTSNMSLNSLKYDDRITNRIKERNFCVDFPEESVREHIAEKNRREMVGSIRNERKSEETGTNYR